VTSVVADGTIVVDTDGALIGEAVVGANGLPLS